VRAREKTITQNHSNYRRPLDGFLFSGRFSHNQRPAQAGTHS
jgi:hypothetical protein